MTVCLAGGESWELQGASEEAYGAIWSNWPVTLRQGENVFVHHGGGSFCRMRLELLDAVGVSYAGPSGRNGAATAGGDVGKGAAGFRAGIPHGLAFHGPANVPIHQGRELHTEPPGANGSGRLSCQELILRRNQATMAAKATPKQHSAVAYP